MKLVTLLPQLNKDLLSRFGRTEIKGISCNSKTVSKGYAFVAIKGTKIDANKFIDEAIEKGACVVISDSDIKYPDSKKALFLKVEDTRQVLAEISANFYARPSEKIEVIGITGTNGKTTISYLLEHILKKSGFNVGVIGTINYRLKDRIIPATNTTPGPLEIQSLLSQMVEDKLKYAVMEVSSHALDQKRVERINFASAIFTNLTGEHLDYHLNLENYFSAKAKLFTGLNKSACAIVNLDDKYADKLIKMTKAVVVTYGLDRDCDVKARDLKLSISETAFDIESKEGKIQIKTKLLGKHNVYNILAAVSFALSQNLNLDIVRKAIEDFKGVPGRLEEIDLNSDFKVFVDFAHTPDALLNVLNSLRQISSSRIILVFGCGGDRDRTKRPLMGKIAESLADFSFVTADNPRKENPQTIADEIIQGMKSENHKIILDRALAIKEALSMAKKDDIVLIAGKGHEGYQIFKDTTVSFDDRLEVKKALGCLH